ncbi:TBC1 domain family member 22B-like isoform X1 [Biomphalaria glabrata]|uniref:TBC1 domain family member 22B-like isoform X1 n=3 Tax=Biomphalaria TaxID=6525 RepID=A0A9W3A6X4_BIOGL|nr:TBC1 domain family member 22B-like isoform X1 [Biomphalaria glabrata]KAI8728722.1 TBC1 domain family member 22B-like [Biomphalaria glabrata]KAI8782075.1 TBC1 domain family member 22B [Biomphalaria glabrata]KAK0043345.1 TBC1 domain family member 22B [Biomphalaria pfeifferi]
MASLSSGSSRENKAGFWKKNSSVPGSIKPVYGAQHPPPQSNINMPSGRQIKKDEKAKHNKKDAFHEFENKTSDAWDDGDDDLIQMANLKLSLKDVHTSAKVVLDNHSKKANSLQKQQLEDNAASNNKGLNSPQSYNSNHHHPHHYHGGPGLGVRLNSGGYQPPKMTSIRYVTNTAPDREATKIDKFKALFAEPSLDLSDLRQLCWSGIPKAVRPTAWKILSGYLPTAADRRQETLERKRKEYFGYIDQYYETRYQDLHEETFRQILKDIPRMTTLAHLFQEKAVQEIFERILYIWAIRHPASGYVQGINDLVTPFFVVFLSEYIENDIEVENCDLTELPQSTRDLIEADSFWCMSKLLDGIQDNYTFAQPGIQMKVNALRELIKRIDAPLFHHLERQGVEFLQFSFRWMNNLLMREIPLRCTIRLWDTYQSEINGFADFHLYVCAAFLKRFSEDALREQDFQGILMLLQNLPTLHWKDKEISELLAEAYKLKYMFADAPRHLLLKS